MNLVYETILGDGTRGSGKRERGGLKGSENLSTKVNEHDAHFGAAKDFHLI